jgi:hypothetical protein
MEGSMAGILIPSCFDGVEKGGWVGSGICGFPEVIVIRGVFLSPGVGILLVVGCHIHKALFIIV